MPRICATIILLFASPAFAGPNVVAGDLALRQDIQRLAAHGVIEGTISTWPLAWGPILNDIENADPSGLPADVIDALARVRARARWDTRSDELTFDAGVGVADNATRIRSFENTPRGRAEAAVGLNWIGGRISVGLSVQYVDSSADDDDLRVDDSMLGVVIGNWSIAASTQQRWWGPGWDGSIILSNNARPIPSLVVDRVFTDAFETRWLSWIGPWDVTVLFGQLEKEREIPNARFFGMRVNVRPLRTLEIGLSRTAQWCGDGRPCDGTTFGNLLIGRDNRGDDVDIENEPGNQLAGFDVRWTPNFLGNAVGFYLQGIGEDEAGGLPSRYLGQLGVDWSGYVFDRWSAQAYVEYSGTACQFHESSKIYNCGYNHSIYGTGYRYRGRPIGHGVDNDAELFSFGLILVDADDTQWRALIRTGELNAGGAPDLGNTLTAMPQDLMSIDLAHSRAFTFGVAELGIGYETIDDAVAGSSSSEGRIYLQWRSSY